MAKDSGKKKTRRSRRSSGAKAEAPAADTPVAEEATPAEAPAAEETAPAEEKKAE